jgi:hypothetical protein
LIHPVYMMIGSHEITEEKKKEKEKKKGRERARE